VPLFLANFTIEKVGWDALWMVQSIAAKSHNPAATKIVYEQRGVFKLAFINRGALVETTV